jgi:hypothetical protein
MFHLNLKIKLPDLAAAAGDGSNRSTPLFKTNASSHLIGNYDLAAYLNLTNGSTHDNYSKQATHNHHRNPNNYQHGRNGIQNSHTHSKSNNNSQLGNYFIREESAQDALAIDDDYYYAQPALQSINKLNSIKSHNNLNGPSPTSNPFGNNLNDINWRLNMIRQKNNSQISNLSSHHFTSQKGEALYLDNLIKESI